MDQNSLKEAAGVIDALEEALRPIGLTAKRLDAAETGNIPTVLLRRERADGSPSVVCSVMPVRMGGVDTVFVQLYMTLTAPAPEDRRAELDRFVKGVNERFMLGSLLVFQGSLCMRYTMALDPGTPLNPEHTQAAVTAFLQQAAVYAGLGSAVGGGTMTAEAALTHRE